MPSLPSLVHALMSDPLCRYRGHLSVKTVKDVSFVCPDESLVAAGSDDGRIFIWDRTTGDSSSQGRLQQQQHQPLLLARPILASMIWASKYVVIPAACFLFTSCRGRSKH
jgi:WD40 repeat protein